MLTPSADAVRRFAEDLRAVREGRDVPLDRLYAVSRIPIDVLRDFEKTGLADNRMFNRVYLRSLVRTYADAVGLPTTPVLNALDTALDGQYDGEVATMASSGRRDPAPAAPEETLSEAGDAPVVASEAPDTEDVSAAPTATETPEADTAVDEALPTAAPTIEGIVESPEEPATPARRRVRAPDLPPTYSPVIPTPDPSLYAYEPERRLPGWAMALLGLVVLLGIGGGLAWWLTRDDEPDRTPVAPRTTPVPARPDSARTPQPSAPVTLPDTLRLVMQATGGPLRGIRVTVDQDVRRPYWLEQGEQRTFAFRDSIKVHEPPAEATLSVQGQPVPASARRPDGNVVVRRADLAAGR